MMSLVAYDHSDDSEEELVTFPQSKKTLSTHVSNAAPKKQRDCVKITIPSLKEFEDEECPVVPKKQKIQSGSGLFSLLPPPKNTSTSSKPGFVPYILSSKKKPVAPPKKSETKVAKNEASGIITPAVHKEQDYDEVSYSSNNSSDNSHATLSKDYFSLDDVGSEKKLDSKEYLHHDLKADSPLSPVQRNNLIQKASSSVELSSMSGSDVQQTFISDSVGSSYVQQNHLPTDDSSNYNEEHSVDSTSESFMNYSTEPAAESYLKESLLKDKEFIKLQGHRREFEAVDIIDVKADDQLTDRNEWLTKSLTEESTHRPSRKKCNMPTQQQKRKHQITYLAFQAKEREMDLKNQWAMNSRTRRETQAKYGF